MVFSVNTGDFLHLSYMIITVISFSIPVTGCVMKLSTNRATILTLWHIELTAVDTSVMLKKLTST